MNMEERNGQSSSEDPLSGGTSWDDLEYLEWVREREQEALEAKLPKKVTFKEILFTSVFVLIILAVAIYLPFKAITGDEGEHKSYSLWVEDLSKRTELVVAEYVFLGSNQVSGVYFGREDLIIIERRADSTTYIHELAHAADKHNYFPWEEELKRNFSTFVSEELSSLLLEGASGQKYVVSCSQMRCFLLKQKSAGVTLVHWIVMYWRSQQKISLKIMAWNSVN